MNDITSQLVAALSAGQPASATDAEALPDGSSPTGFRNSKGQFARGESANAPPEAENPILAALMEQQGGGQPMPLGAAPEPPSGGSMNPIVASLLR